MKRFVVLVLLVFAFGCAKRTATTVPQGMETQPQQKVSEGAKSAGQPGGEHVSEQLAKETRTPTPMEEAKSIFSDIHFDFDRYNIKDDAKPVLEKIAGWLSKNRNVKVLIEGNCDERGTIEYNLALGEKRAKAAKDYLISLGISPARIATISYGKEKPLCTEHNEECWAKNRRDHFVIQ